jgi:predicted LPLAT superfamily acyltransferase
MPDNYSWEGRSRGNTLGYSIFIGVLRTGGIKAAYKLLYLVTLYYRWFMPSAITPLSYLYTQRLGYEPRKSSELIKQNLIHFGQSIIDKVAVLSGIKTRFDYTHEGIEHIEQLVKEGKGGFLVSAHIGNWEVAGHLLKRVEATINILMYDGEDAAIKSYMQQFDEKRSFNIIYVKEDMTHIYEISAALNRNELICLHADRFRPGNRTIVHDFLNEKARFPAGPFILASKLKAPVCFVFAFKESDFKYHFYSTEQKIYPGNGSIGAEKMLDDYIGILETKLKQYPDQWYNYYNFWKA